MDRLAETPCKAGKAILSYLLIFFSLQDLFENIQDAFETDLDMDLDSFTQGETEFAGQVTTFSIFLNSNWFPATILFIGKKSFWYFTSPFLFWHLFFWLSRCLKKGTFTFFFTDNKLA